MRLRLLLLAFYCVFLVDGAGVIQSCEPVTGLNVPGSGFKSIGLSTKLTLHARYIGLINRGRVRQVSLLLGAFFRQDVTLEGVLPLDLARSRELKALLRACFCFHLRHGLRFLVIYFFFGLKRTVIRFPSSFGSCSTVPNSSSSCANFRSKISPRSLKTIVRPRKKT